MILDDKANHVVVIMPSWVGDIVMATPALRLLHQAMPNTSITAALRPGLAPLLEGIDAIQNCIEIQPKGLLGPFTAGRKIGRLNSDAVILLPNSMRSALTARLSNTRIRIGSARQGRSSLLTHAIASPSTGEIRTTLDDYLAMANEITGSGTDDRQPRLGVTPNDLQAASNAMALDGEPFVVLVPGANRMDKRWPARQFSRIAERLSHERGLRIAVAGSPAEQPLVRSLVEEATCPTIDLAAANPGLGGLKAIMQAASLVITNDTGPRHIAAALGTPVVSLFGPTDHRWTVLPDIAERRLLAEPFLPDSLVADKCPGICRIDRITVEDVYAAAAELLS